MFRLVIASELNHSSSMSNAYCALLVAGLCYSLKRLCRYVWGWYRAGGRMDLKLLVPNALAFGIGVCGFDLVTWDTVSPTFYPGAMPWKWHRKLVTQFNVTQRVRNHKNVVIFVLGWGWSPMKAKWLASRSGRLTQLWWVLCDICCDGVTITHAFFSNGVASKRTRLTHWTAPSCGSLRFTKSKVGVCLA